jgi:hypothetical protein
MGIRGDDFVVLSEAISTLSAGDIAAQAPDSAASTTTTTSPAKAQAWKQRLVNLDDETPRKLTVEPTPAARLGTHSLAKVGAVASRVAASGAPTRSSPRSLTGSVDLSEDGTAQSGTLSPRSRRVSLSASVESGGPTTLAIAEDTSPRAGAAGRTARFSLPTQSSAQRVKPRKSNPALQQTVFEL